MYHCKYVYTCLHSLIATRDFALLTARWYATLLYALISVNARIMRMAYRFHLLCCLTLSLEITNCLLKPK